MLPDDDSIIDVFLQPGELYCGDASTRIRTLLGSCVATTIWHRRRRIGGMTHCLLPSNTRHGKGEASDGRFCDEALEIVVGELFRSCDRPSEYEAKLFGGSDMFGAEGARTLDIGRKNVAKATALLERFGLRLVAQDVGGPLHRSVIFEIATGDVWVNRGAQAGTAAATEVLE